MELERAHNLEKIRQHCITAGTALTDTPITLVVVLKTLVEKFQPFQQAVTLGAQEPRDIVSTWDLSRDDISKQPNDVVALVARSL